MSRARIRSRRLQLLHRGRLRRAGAGAPHHRGPAPLGELFAHHRGAAGADGSRAVRDPRSRGHVVHLVSQESDRGELPRRGCTPIYDFCFIDGAKNWTIDGFAFVLVDKLLRPGGWILFDDYAWTYGASGQTTTAGINHLEMGPDELTQPHIELVVRLLVMQHPSYSEIRIQDDCWAWARKTTAPTTRVIIENSYTFKALLLRVLRGAARRLRIGQLEGV